MCKKGLTDWKLPMWVISVKMLKETWLMDELLDESHGLLPAVHEKYDNGKRSQEAYHLKISNCSLLGECLPLSHG
jgi:hypothetical protein